MRYSPVAVIVALCLLSNADALRIVVAAETYEVTLEKDVEYGTGGGEKLYLDLAKPVGIEVAAPAVIFIHGGGWAGGNRQDLHGEIRRMAAEGFVTATITYRLAPKHRFPAQIEDCKCAVRWMRAHADRLHVDPERIGALGLSAGAHLSMMLGAMDAADGLEGDGGWPDQSSKVQAVVSYVGPTNLVGEYPEISQRIVSNFIGGSLADVQDTYALASPITYVNAGDAAMLLFQGTTDVLVPYDQAFQMARALDEAKIPGRVELLVGHGHGWGGAELDRTRAAGIEFLKQRLSKHE